MLSQNEGTSIEPSGERTACTTVRGEGKVGNKVRRRETRLWCKRRREEREEARNETLREREREGGEGERERQKERKSEKERRVRRGGGGETRLPRMLRDCIATWECNDCTGARLAPTCTHVHTRRSWECADPYQHGKRSLTSLRRPLPLPRTHTRSRDAFRRGTCDMQPKRVARVSKGAKIHNSSFHIHNHRTCLLFRIGFH